MLMNVDVATEFFIWHHANISKKIIMTFIISASALENLTSPLWVLPPSAQYNIIPISHSSFGLISFISLLAASIIICLFWLSFFSRAILLFSTTS